MAIVYIHPSGLANVSGQLLTDESDQIKGDILAAIFRHEESIEITSILLLSVIDALKECVPGFSEALEHHRRQALSGELGQKLASAVKEHAELLGKLQGLPLP